MKLHEAAIFILKEKKKPLGVLELWSAIESRELFKTDGDTPWLTLSTVLRRKTKGILKCTPLSRQKFVFFKSVL